MTRNLKDDLAILNEIPEKQLPQTLFRLGTPSHVKSQSALANIFQSKAEFEKAQRKLEDSVSKEREAQATKFTQKMSRMTDIYDSRRTKRKNELLERVHSYQAMQIANKEAELEMLNQEKRVIIGERLQKNKQEFNQRSNEIKRSYENFILVKRNLSPLLEVEYQKQIDEKDKNFAEEMLKRRKSLLRPVHMPDLYAHAVKMKVMESQRETEWLMRQSHMDRSYNPLEHTKYQSNPYFLKKAEVSQNHAKSMKYADIAQESVEQRSPPQVIQDWEQFKRRKNFGYFFRQEVIAKKQEKEANFDPDIYLRESIQTRLRGDKRKLSQSLGNVAFEEDHNQKPPNYGEFIKGQVDYSKVNDDKLSNKNINYYERVERAKRFAGQAVANNHLSPTVKGLDELANSYARSPNSNVFKRYMVSVGYLEKMALEREKVEKMAKNQPSVANKKNDSIDLLSTSIKSKLKLLRTMQEPE